MILLADPQRCPSCRHALPPSPLVCAACDLDLRGERGVRLFGLLTEADGLIAQMRAGAVATATDVPATPEPGPVSVAPAVRVATVPAVLLGLGALCVLVAASLFLPFAWELLGVLGRTIVLIALTAAAAAAARAAGARGLRASAEALGVVSLGLLTFDLVGVRSSGWLGDIGDPEFAILLGAVLVAAGTSGALWLRRTKVGTFVGGEVVATIGGVVLAFGGAALDAGTLAQRLALLVPVLGVITMGTAALRAARPGVDSLTVAATGLLAVTVTAWCALTVTGLGQLADGSGGVPSWASMWPGGAGLTLLLTGAYVALPALARSLAPAARSALLAVALVPWGVMLTAPAYDEGTSWRTLVAVATLLGCLLATRLGPAPWRWVFLPLGALSGLAAAMLTTPLAGAAVATGAATVSPPWAGSPGGRAVPTAATSWASIWDADLGSPWLLPVVALTLVLALASVAGHLRPVDGDRPTRVVLAAAGVAVTVLALVGALLLEELPVWCALTVLLAVTVALGVVATIVEHDELHLTELVLGGTALLLSWHDEWLTLTTCLVLAALGARHHARGPYAVRVGGGLTLTAMLAGALWAGGDLTSTATTWSALLVLLAVGALAIARGRLETPGVVGVDVAAACVAAVATWVAVADAAPQQATWLAVMLTAAGVCTTLVALTRPYHRRVGWAGALLLAAASWVRLAEVGVTAPEAYTLPSALALLVAGWHRTRTDPAASTLAAWSPGLGLALVPSLVWALADPLSWRALLLGATCFVLTVVGAQRRVAAPFAWGAAVGGVLVAWEVLPPALEMSAWLVTGLAGATLLVLGASWEQRVRDARTALGYLRALH